MSPSTFQKVLKDQNIIESMPLKSPIRPNDSKRNPFLTFWVFWRTIFEKCSCLVGMKQNLSFSFVLIFHKNQRETFAEKLNKKLNAFQLQKFSNLKIFE